MTGLTLTLALSGVAVGLWGRYRWRAAVVWPPLRSLATLLRRELGFRDAYTWVGVVVVRLSHLLAETDRRTFDRVSDHVAAGAINSIRIAARLDRAVFDASAAWITSLALRAIGAASQLDARRIDAFVAKFGGVLVLSQRLRAIQTGRIENYLMPLFVWSVLIMALTILMARAG